MRDRVARAAILTTGMGVLLLIAACQQFGHQTGCGPDGCPAGDGCHDHAKVCADPTVHALACDLDHLEKHIDWYGSVVPKVPDVWGQARLTQYREEFEREMHKELVTFGETLNGSLSRSDQAYFAQATALGLAAQPKPPVIGRVVSDKTVAGPTGPPAPAVVETSREVVLVEKAQDGNARTTTSTFGPPAAPPPPAPEPPAPAPIPPPPAADPTTMISEVDKVLARNNATVRQIGFAAAGNGPVRLEPTLFLAQKQRYLDYLNQLRRTNEGADTADAPGYSLNLMRVPVSVLPGKRTDVGHGAEVTFSLEPVLGDDLLPMTYRNFVTNDLVHSLGFPLTKLLDDERTREAEKQFLSEEVREALRVQELSTMPALGRSGVAATGAVLQGQGVQPARFQTPGSPETAPNSKAAAGRWSLHQLAEDIQSKPLGAGPAQTAPRAGRAPNPEQRTENNTSAVGAAIKSVALNFTATHMSFSNGTRDRQAFPTSQMFDVYGANFSFEIAYGAKQALASDIIRNKYVHLPDVQAYLQEEIRAAHQFLAEPAHQYLWQSFCTPDLVAMIRSHQWQEIRVQRTLFRDAVMKITGSKQLELVPALNKDGTPKIDDKGQFETETNSPSVTRQFSVTSALAWGIIVDSALLTDRLIRDMRETATAKGKPCPGDGAWLPYFLPCPPPEARMAFAEYVKVRWPIHVFALDPVTQDQNIADALSTRRETQLALSIAFTNGFINANTLTRYARRLEAEYETVALNRTQVGFAHGENTFGWRFYPRFQTPDTESNLTVLFRDQLIGGPNRNQLARHARLEPGPRDCVALVIMPSFVPYVTVDSVSNWFGLANPKHKVLDHTQAVRLSKTVRTLEKCGPGVMDADCYRDGEVRRLQKRVDQLANRLPAQTLTVPVPILNTLGGFEMFSNGVTDLAPELYGWYGAPGVRTGTSVPPTTLFLVGDHFSPLKSRVVIGNAAVTRGDTVPGALLVGAAATTPENQRMLSRQVMEVTIDGARVFPVVGADGRKYVEAHVATPYGVSRELLIPVYEPDAKPAKPAEGYTLNPNEATATYRLVPDEDTPGTYRYLEVAKVSPAKIKVDWVDSSGSVPNELTVRFAFEWLKTPLPVPLCKAVRAADNEFVIPEDELKNLAAAVIKGVRTVGLTPGASPFDAPFTTTEVRITPVSGTHAVAGVKATNQFKLTFAAELVAGACPPTPKAAPAPAPGAGRDPATLPPKRKFDDGPPPPEPGGRYVFPPAPADLLPPSAAAPAVGRPRSEALPVPSGTLEVASPPRAGTAK